RYFMTIPEAAQLILQAASLGRGGEIFVLEMGEPVRIVDLARQMIRLSGFEPDEDIAAVCTGLRAGEKLHVDLVDREEAIVATHHDRIKVLRSTDTAWRPEQWLIRFEDTIKGGDVASTIRFLRLLVPAYRPSSELVSHLADGGLDDFGDGREAPPAA